MNRSEAIAFLKEVERTQKIIMACAAEAAKKFQDGSLGKSISDKWASLLVEMNTHMASINRELTKPVFDEIRISGDLMWFRSLARKLDYFNLEEINSARELASSVDKLFALTI